MYIQNLLIFKSNVEFFGCNVTSLIKIIINKMIIIVPKGT